MIYKDVYAEVCVCSVKMVEVGELVVEVVELEVQVVDVCTGGSGSKRSSASGSSELFVPSTALSTA